MGVMVAMGLGTPRARCFVSVAIVGLTAYAFKLPQQAFKRDGTMKPFKPLSFDPEATNAHFLLIPVSAGLCVYLFT